METKQEKELGEKILKLLAISRTCFRRNIEGEKIFHNKSLFDTLEESLYNLQCKLGSLVKKRLGLKFSPGK